MGVAMTHDSASDTPAAPPPRAQREAERAIALGLTSSIIITLWMPSVLFIRHGVVWFLANSGANAAEIAYMANWVMWVIAAGNGFLCLGYIDLQMKQTLLRSAVDTQREWWDTMLSFLPIMAFVVIILLWFLGKVVLHWPEFWVQVLIVLVAFWDLRFGRWVSVRVTVRYAHVDETGGAYHGAHH